MARRPRAEFEITAENRAGAVLQRVDNQLKAVAGTARFAAGAFVLLQATRYARDIAQFADSFTALNIRVQSATRLTGDYVDVQRELLSIAVDTGVALESQVDTFQALARVREDIGATNEQFLTLNRTIAQLGVIGGTAQDNLRFGLRQFNQAIASGVFRAEEFNSIVENIPELARAIADGFGVTQGQLRAMVLEGRLFSNEVLQNLLSQAEEVDERFSRLPVTLARGSEALRSAIGARLSEINDELGITTSLGRALQVLAEAIAPAPDLNRVQRLNERLAITQEQLKAATGEAEALQRQIEGSRGGRRFTSLQRLEVVEEKIAKLTEDAKNLNQFLDLARGEATRERVRQQEDFEPPEETAQQKREREQREKREAQQRFQDRLLFEQEAQAALLRQAAGFNTQREFAEFQFQERLRAAEESAHTRKLEDEQRRFEDLLAQELGYEDRRAQEIEQRRRDNEEAILRERYRGNELAQKAITELRKFEENNAVQRTNQILGLAQELTAGLASESRALFNINKAASLAEAIINTATGVTAALKRGPSGIPLAALIAAQGAAQIATISATQFGGGNSGNTSFGAATGIPSAASADVLRGVPVVSAEDNVQRIELVIRGEGQIEEAIADSITRGISDADVVIIDERSRQALDLGGRF